jgi:hypothetical protein
MVPGKGWGFSLRHPIQIGSGAHPASSTMSKDKHKDKDKGKIKSKVVLVL